MFLKSLTITSDGNEIRRISFRQGLNLIVDESTNQVTGNGIGKTTVLKLVDFCLGANPKNIYIDPESKKQEHKAVKDYLINKRVLITLVLVSSFENQSSDEIIIERNFLSKKDLVRRINGNQLTEEEFLQKLSNLIFPKHFADKPTFRQIISHNVRYKDESINNTLKTLDKFTSDAEYETLYLFLFGVEYTQGNEKQEILIKLNQEENYKKRLERDQTKTAYETTLALINNDISTLNEKRSSLNLNESFESDVDSLNNLKYDINKLSSSIGKLNIRKDLIIETEKTIRGSKSNIDLQQLELIYQQASNQLSEMQKTFNELVSFHNKMIEQKVKFVSKELPEIEADLLKKKSDLNLLLKEEKLLTEKISKSESFEELEEIIAELNDKYQRRGEYENVLSQLVEVEENIKGFNLKLEKIDNELFSDEFENHVKDQLNKFNVFFASISDKLYGEQYAIKYDIVTNRKKQRIYKFDAFNTNLSSGKKQGEISCFDIAYTLFADEENIPCLHFLLNDKKELMHDNQLVKIAEFVSNNNIQFVASILKDKLPDEIDREEFFVLKLSDSDKLFRIES